MSIVSTVGIDLAKNVFSVHAVGERGAVVVRRTVSRTKLAELVAQLPPCLIGMEACSGAHDWARRFSALGHTVKLTAPKFVMPHRLGDLEIRALLRRQLGQPGSLINPLSSALHSSYHDHEQRIGPRRGKADNTRGLQRLSN
jgi:transposase